MCCSFISEPRYGQAFGAGFSGTAVSNEKIIRLTAADELRRPDRFLPSARVRLYLADHGGDILLHKAAKKAFDELGVKKLPTVKSLQEEYAKLLAEKKAAYAEYRRSRDEMRELLLHKQNVDRTLAKTSASRRRKRSMTGNNGHATKRFAETRSRASFAFKGFLGALPRQAEGSFRGGENSPEMQKRALFALLARLLRL